MRRLACLGLFLLLGAARPAAATEGPLTSIFGGLGSTFGSVGNSLMEFVDCVEANGAIGPGFKIGLEAVFVRIGGGLVTSTRAGIDGRQTGTWSERDAMMGLAPFSLILAPCELLRGNGDTWRGLANAFEVLSLGVERMERDNFHTSTILYHKTTMIGGWNERPGDKYSIGAEAHLVYLGGRLRFKPYQLVAAVAGIFGYDMSASMAHPEFSGYAQGRPR